MPSIAVTGSSGFIGAALCMALEARGDRVLRLMRGSALPGQQKPGIAWDPEAGTIDSAGLAGIDALVHLAGEGIAARRWSEDQKERIKKSRVRGTQLLAEALSQLSPRPRTFLCASAIGIYGDRGATPLDEQAEPGSDFLSEVGVAWEAAAQPAEQAGIRVAHARFGIVLHPEGGALAKLLPPFRLGVGGKLGNGRQYMSWIARSDAVRALLHILDTETLRGPINVTAPNPVTNAQLTEELGKALHRPTIFTVPGFAARALFGEMAQVALLSGARVLPRRLLETGFVFEQPALAGCLKAVLA